MSVMTVIALTAWRARSRYLAARMAASDAPGRSGPINAPSTVHSCISCDMNVTIGKGLGSSRRDRWAVPGHPWMKQSTARNANGRCCRTSRSGCRPRTWKVMRRARRRSRSPRIRQIRHHPKASPRFYRRFCATGNRDQLGLLLAVEHPFDAGTNPLLALQGRLEPLRCLLFSSKHTTG